MASKMHKKGLAALLGRSCLLCGLLGGGHAHALFMPNHQDQDAMPVTQQQADDKPIVLRPGPWVPPEMLKAFEEELRLLRQQQMDAEQQAKERAEKQDLSLLKDEEEQPLRLGLYGAADIGLNPSLWLNTSDDIIRNILSKLPETSYSVSMNRWLGHLRKAEFSLPEGQSRLDYFLDSLTQLHRLGDVEAVAQMIAAIPPFDAALKDRPEVLWILFEQDLYYGDVPAACEKVARYQELYLDAEHSQNWTQAMMFCAAVAGNREAAAGYAELIDRSDPSNAQLVDMMVELIAVAEGTAKKDTGAVPKQLAPSPLSYRLLGLLDKPVSAEFIFKANYLTKRMLMTSSAVSNGNRYELARALYMSGVISTTIMADFYSVFGELAVADKVRNGQDVDAGNLSFAEIYYRLNRALSRPESVGSLDTAEVDSLAARLLAVKDVVPGTDIVSTMPLAVFKPLFKSITPGPDHMAAVPVMVRSLLLENDLDTARLWYAIANNEAQKGNGDAVQAIIRLWPLMLVTGAQQDIVYADQILTLWQRQLGGDDALRLKKLSGLYAMLEALGYPVSNQHWLDVLDVDVSVQGRTPSIGVWRRLMIAAASAKQGETLALALTAMGKEGPQGMDASAMSAIIHGLKQVGLESIARQFAYEYLLTLGL